MSIEPGKYSYKTLRQRIVDFLCFPLIATVSNDRVESWGLTSITKERISHVLDCCQGFVLDVGCGDNRLVRQWGKGVGLEVYPWHGIDILGSSYRMPFPAKVFDTAVYSATINHIPRRELALRETYRVLKDDGRVVVSYADPILGWIGHRILWRYDEHIERGMAEGETCGFWTRDVEALLQDAGFVVVERVRFFYGLNNIMIAEKAIGAPVTFRGEV